MKSDVMNVLEQLRDIPYGDLRYEIEKLHAIREWALQELAVDFSVGDQVRITKDLNITAEKSWGWMPYKEALAVGATGVVQAIDFNSYWKYWYAEIVLDREWSNGSSGKDNLRYWHGKASDCPTGYVPPSQFDQEHYPEGRRGIFSISVTKLSKVITTTPQRRSTDAK